jgi:hypothetical protein
MLMPHGFLTVETVTTFEPSRALHASYCPEGDWISADRAGLTETPYGANIDYSVILDFYADGYLSAAELLGPKNVFEESAVSRPSAYERAVIRLSSIPEMPGSAEFDDDITIVKNADGTVVRASISDGTPAPATWFALSDTVYIALDAGRFVSMLFLLHE